MIFLKQCIKTQKSCSFHWKTQYSCTGNTTEVSVPWRFHHIKARGMYTLFAVSPDTDSRVDYLSLTPHKYSQGLLSAVPGLYCHLAASLALWEGEDLEIPFGQQALHHKGVQHPTLPASRGGVEKCTFICRRNKTPEPFTSRCSGEDWTHSCTFEQAEMGKRNNGRAKDSGLFTQSFAYLLL